MKKEVPIFEAPDLSKPKNSLDLLRWVYEEPGALRELNTEKNIKERLSFLLKNASIFFCLSFLLCYHGLLFGFY